MLPAYADFTMKLTLTENSMQEVYWSMLPQDQGDTQDMYLPIMTKFNTF